MKHLFTAVFALLFFVGCDDAPVENNSVPNNDEVEETAKGVYGVDPEFYEVDNMGGEMHLEFFSFDEWRLSSNEEWCTLSIDSGAEGEVVVVVNIAPNPNDDVVRKAEISIDVEGYASDLVICNVSQSADVESDVINGADCNKWIASYMSANYLWNNEFNEIKSRLNYWVDAPTFLNNALTRMDGIDEDGKFYTSGERYYYSHIDVYGYAPAAAPATKALTTKMGYGINMVYPVSVSQTEYYLLVVSVVEDSPAAMAGIKRGMYITQYNGQKIVGNMLDEAYNTLMEYAEPVGIVSLKLAQYQADKMNNYSLKDIGEKVLSPIVYARNPIIYKAAFQTEDKSHTIGYLVYSEFDKSADSELVDLFSKFKLNNVTDLILDLRYNGGGDVQASAVLGTLIAGAEHKGEVYCQMEFNEYRKARGEVEYFYIGKNPSMQNYPLIEQALDNSLGLKRVYVIGTGFTASASELIINGLRGLGIEVILVGETTEGKNVGMEVIISSDKAYEEYDFGEYQYIFAPITFYNLNAQGFKEFAEGFAPDFNVVETDNIIFDWDQSYKGYDEAVAAAIAHIRTGAWPVDPTKAMAIRSVAEPLKVVQKKGLHPRGGGARVYKSGFDN